jgi:hypothetical protein
MPKKKRDNIQYKIDELKSELRLNQSDWISMDSQRDKEDLLLTKEITQKLKKLEEENPEYFI